jgi:hypothetical protein
MSLWTDFLTNDQRVIHKWTHYFPAYESHFGRFRNRSLMFLEIGCGEGGSLQMWKRYFGPVAQIVGVDIRQECSELEEDQITVRIGDQGDPVFLSSLVEEFGPPDIVLDDGSHKMSDMVASFSTLYPAMSKNGVYVVEDLHTCYWEEYDGGFRREGTFIELCKTLIDQLNAEHSRGAVLANEFSTSTTSIHFYDSLVVFERGRYLRKHAPEIGKR